MRNPNDPRIGPPRPGLRPGQRTFLVVAAFTILFLILLAGGDGFVGFVVFAGFFMVIFGAIGQAIGESKGRGREAFWWSFWLGVIGWIIVAVWEPSEEIRTERNRATAEALATAVTNRGPDQATRLCPWCAETIKAAAIICRYCGRDVEPTDGPITTGISATPSAHERRPCPFCSELVLPAAHLCPHCRTRLSTLPPEKAPTLPSQDAPTLPSPPAGTAEGWLQDPSARHPLRWWNGTEWTRWVLDKRGGTRSENAPTLPSPHAGTAEGWLQDPSGRHALRWWNGKKWSRRVFDKQEDPAL